MDIPYHDLIGIPFVDGGRSKETGFDCWGFVREVYRRMGVSVRDYHISAIDKVRIAGRMSIDSMGEDWEKLDKPQAGCVVLIRLSTDVWANHVGICIGDGKFVHAYSPTGVSVGRLARWKNRIAGYYRPRGSEIDG